MTTLLKNLFVILCVSAATTQASTSPQAQLAPAVKNLVIQAITEVFGSDKKLPRKKVYLHCARKLHPDKHDSDHELYKEAFTSASNYLAPEGDSKKPDDLLNKKELIGRLSSNSWISKNAAADVSMALVRFVPRGKQ